MGVAGALAGLRAANSARADPTEILAPLERPVFAVPASHY